MDFVQLYGHRLCAPSRSVEVLCKLLSIPYKCTVIEVSKGQQKRPQFLSLFPLAKIPAIKHRELTIGESHAILTYLHAAFHGPEEMHPIDCRQRAKVNQYLHWHHSHISEASTLVFMVLFAPYMCIPVPRELIEETRGKVHSALETIETWLGNTPFIAGQSLTIADLSAFQEVHQLSLLGYSLAGFPRIQRWCESLLAISEVKEVSSAVDSFKEEHTLQSLDAVLGARLKVFGFPLSAPFRAIEVMCKVANIPYQFVLVDLPKREHKQPAFLSVNPLGQVPAILDGDFQLGESHAILTYLHTTYQAADSLYPADPRKRAKVDQYMHWHHANTRKASALVFAVVFAPRLRMPLPPAFVKDHEAMVRKAMEVVEQWLTGSDYVAGEELTIADISAFQEVHQLSLIDYDLREFPHMQAWQQRLLQVPAFKEAAAVVDGFKAVLEAEREKSEEV